jgi:hypothetical protein
VRIAPLTGGAAPSVCAVEATGLVCATLASDGTLSPATRLDSPAAPLAIEPDSLALGDVDGDGRTDACGRDAGGILCATAASGYQAVRWTPLWGGTGSASPADRSLTIAPDGALCELDAAGAACLTKAATAVTDVRSTWPDRQAALWFGDLDGDGQLDWCAATPAGPACSLAADRAVTQDGIAWGYSLGAVVAASTADGPVPDTDTAALGDGDGDGRADLCTATGTAIACARSLSHGFGPPTPIARLPTGLSPTSVWAAPSGSPVALCAADATAIACTVTAGTN